MAAPLRPVPASSAAATNDSPFQAAEIAVAATRSGTTIEFGASSAAAVAPSTAHVAKPIQRRGMIRVATLSDQRPEPIRNTIATPFATANAPAAAAGENPRSSCRKSTTKLNRAIWVTT